MDKQRPPHYKPIGEKKGTSGSYIVIRNQGEQSKEGSIFEEKKGGLRPEILSARNGEKKNK